MTGIWEYPELQTFEDEIFRAFQETIDELSEQFPEREPAFRNLQIERVAVLEEWGRGTAQKTEDPVNIMLYVDFEDRERFIEPDTEVRESDIFGIVSRQVVERIQEEFRPDETMREWFGGIVFGAIPATNYEESISFFMNQAQPNLAYNLSTRTILELTDTGQVAPQEVTETTEEAVEEVEEIDEEDQPTDILEFPQKQELIQRLSDTFREAKEIQIRESPAGDALENVTVDQYIIVGEWGRGTGDFGEDPLSVFVSLTAQEVDNLNQIPGFSRESQQLAERMEDTFGFTPTMRDWFSDIIITNVASGFLDQSLEVNIRGDAPQRAYNLTNNSIIRLEEGELQVEPVAQPQEEEPEEPDEEELTEEEVLADVFPGITPELRPFAQEDESLEIPAGKETKTVQPREIYDFEVELASPGDGETGINREIREGIGEAVASQQFGQGAPPATFPRTGIYVKWYLFFRGPAYIYQMYKDLIVYSGYISTLYESNLRAGRYEAFREYMYRLNEVGKRGGPQLVRAIPDDEAQERGLDTEPSLPDGTAAPWLEPRQYYEIIESNIEHEAWQDVVGYLYQQEEA